MSRKVTHLFYTSTLRLPLYIVTLAPQIMEDVASDNRTHMVAIGKEYQDMVNQLITVKIKSFLSQCRLILQ